MFLIILTTPNKEFPNVNFLSRLSGHKFFLKQYEKLV